MALYNPYDEDELSFTPEKIDALLQQYQSAQSPSLDVARETNSEVPSQSQPLQASPEPQSQIKDYSPDLEKVYNQLYNKPVDPQQEQATKIQALLSQLFRPTTSGIYHGTNRDFKVGQSPEEYDQSLKLRQETQMQPELLKRKQLMDQFSAIKDIQQSQRDRESSNVLNQYRQAEINKFQSQQDLAEKEKGYKIAMRKFGTPESIATTEQVKAQLLNKARNSEALKIPPAIVQILKEKAAAVDGMSGERADLELKMANELTKDYFSDKGADTQRLSVIYAGDRGKEAERHNKIMEQIHNNKLDLNRIKVAHKERGVAGPWLKETADRETMLESYNDIQKAVNEIGGTGYLTAAGNWYDKAVNNQDPKLAKLLAKVELAVGKMRKERFGSSLTVGEKEAAKAFTPSLYQNTEAFLGKLESLKDLASQELAKSTENLLLNNAITYDGDINQQNAYEVSRYIKNKLRSSGIGEQPDNRSIQSGQGQKTKSVSKKMYSPSRNQTKIIYSDGSEEVVDGRQ